MGGCLFRCYGSGHTGGVRTSRLALKSLVVALALVSSLCAAAPTTPYTRMYVFGDSYSDIGAGYVDGNGPTAVAYLGWLMGLQITHAHAANASEKSLVFAVSGARTGEGEGRHIKEALLGYGMLNQVQDFAVRVKSGEIRFDPRTTLFFIAGGLNDGGLPTETTIANLTHLIEILRDLGGRHFTIAQLPTKIPQFSKTAIRLDPAVGQFAEHEGGTLGVDLWLNHWGAGFDDVMEHPDAYGIANTTSPCAGRAIFDEDATPAGDPATFFFYHEGHPSTAVHRVVGKKLFDEVKSHPPASQ
jgi:cholinesterase